jgi:hypothetical protein
MILRRSGIRGDLFANGGDNNVRYGVIVDEFTWRPVRGAVVSISGGDSITGEDGWYRIDFPPGSCGTCNTTFMRVSAPGYEDFLEVAGRGISRVIRVDAALERAAGPFLFF